MIAINNIVSVKQNDIFTDSLVISEGTRKKHPSIQRLLNKHQLDFEEFGKLRFEIRPSLSGQNQKIFILNEQQATLLITYLGNNEIVRAFKINLVQEFFRMRQELMQRQTNDWITSRHQSKLTRKAETDVLKEFVEYAKAQGSKTPEKYYMIFSKLANKIANISGRDKATILELNNLNLVESILLKTVSEEMAKGTHYKEIYQLCKQKLNVFASVAYLAS